MYPTVRKMFTGSDKKGNTLYNSPIVSHLLSRSLKQMIDAWLITKISVLPLLNYANNILYNILHKAWIERDSQNCMQNKFRVFENLALVDEFAGLRNFKHFKSF